MTITWAILIVFKHILLDLLDLGPNIWYIVPEEYKTSSLNSFKESIKNRYPLTVLADFVQSNLYKTDTP